MMVRILFYIVPVAGALLSLRACLVFPKCSIEGLMVIALCYTTLLYVILKKGE